MARIYFIRHGESEANARGILAGQQDSPITTLGVQQAHEVADVILHNTIVFETIITSTLARAYDTARIVAETNGYPVAKIIQLESLCEKHSGAFEGRPPADMFAASESDMQEAGGETLEVFAARVRTANEELVRHAVGATLVVGHSEFYRMAECVQQGLAPEHMHEMPRPDNGKLLPYPLAGQDD